MLKNVENMKYVFVVIMKCINQKSRKQLPQRQVDQSLKERMQHYCGLYDIPHKVVLEQDRLVITSGGMNFIEAENMMTYLKNSQVVFQEQYNNELCACFGKIHQGYEKWEQSYQEARFLIEATQHFSSEQTEWTEHVSVFELLWQCMDGALLERYCKERLQGLLDEAAKTKQDLLEHLKVYLRARYSVKETAEQLGIHRNTLDYRLNKIKKIMKLDENDGFAWAEVMLALLIMEYLDSDFYKNQHL